MNHRVKWDPNGVPSVTPPAAPTPPAPPAPPAQPAAAAPVPPTPEQQELERLRAENVRLTTEATTRDTAARTAEEERQRQQGEWQTLATTTATERDQLKNENAALKRAASINEELHRTALEYSMGAVADAIKLVETETNGTLSPADVIKQAQAKLKGWGLAVVNGAQPIGTGPTPAERGQHGDPRVKRYIELMQKARFDPSKRPDAMRLQAELERDGVTLPYVEAA